MLTYGDIQIMSGDLSYINEIEREVNEFFHLNPYSMDSISMEEAEINIENITPGSIANQVIYHIIYESVGRLNVSEKIRDELRENIYTNCMDSGFINGDAEDYTEDEDERKYLQEFINIF